MDEQRIEAIHNSLTGIEIMSDHIAKFPENYPKNGVLKLSIWAAHHFLNIYKILFYILTKQR